MDKKIKKLWVRALRSGKYKQGEDRLKRDGRYCCLGVLCNVVGAKWRPIEAALVPYLDGKLVGNNSDPSQLIGASLLRRVGMKHETQINLANMNDDGKSFKEISDYIDKRL